MSILRLIPMGASLRVAKGVVAANKLNVSNDVTKELARSTVFTGDKVNIRLTEKFGRSYPDVYTNLIDMSAKGIVAKPEWLLEANDKYEISIIPKYSGKVNLAFGELNKDEQYLIVNSALQAGLSPERTGELFKKIVTSLELYLWNSENYPFSCPRFYYCKDAFKALPAAFEAKYTPEQISELFNFISNETPRYFKSQAISSLPLAIKRLQAPEAVIAHYKTENEKAEARFYL